MQTSYTQDYVIGQVGQIADISDRTIDSFAAEGEIGFGIAVARGTNKQKHLNQRETQKRLVIKTNP